MAVTAKLFTNAIPGFIRGDMKWLTSGGSTFKVALLGSGWTPNQDGNDFWDDISSYEIAAGNGYTAGGATLTTYDPTVDTGTNETRLDAADVTWANSTITARYAVIYYSTGTPGTSRLVGWQDFGEDKVSAAADFKLTWNANGIFAIAAAA